jgi:hypothetical protein
MRALPAAAVAASVVLPLLAVASTTPPATAGPPASAEFRANTASGHEVRAPAVATDSDGDSVVVWSSFGQDGSGAGVYLQRFDSSGAPQGTEFRVNATTTGDQLYPGVAIDDDGDIVVVWQSSGQDGDSGGIYARRYSRGWGSEFRVNTVTVDNQIAPQVDMDATGAFAVTWSSYNQDGADYGIYARRYSASGASLGAAFLVNTTTAGGQFESDIAMSASGAFVIIWEGDGAGGGDGVYSQLYGPGGSRVGGETRADSGGGTYHPELRVAMDAGGDYVLVWNSYAQDGDNDGIYAQRYHAGGAPVGVETRINSIATGSQFAPDVAMSANGDYLVSWTDARDGDEYGVFGRRFAASGSPQGAETRMSSTVADFQEYPAVALDADGDAVVVWVNSTDWYGAAGDVKGRRFRGPDSVDLALHQVDKADPVPVLGTATYRARITNLNDATADLGVPAIDAAIGVATGVYVVSTIPDGATFASASGAGWTCTPGATTVKCRLAGPLAADSVSSWLTLTYNVPQAAGPLVHQARVYENQLDAVPSNNGESETTTALCTVRLSQEGYTTNETGSVGIRWDRTGTDCGPTSVDWQTVAGSATPGADYVDAGGDSPFSDGDTSRMVDIPIYPDAIDERLSEAFKIRLSNPTGMLLAHPSTAVVTIFDDDAPPRINFVATSGSGAEPGALVDVSVRLSAVSGVPITVSLTRSGTATSGADYFAPTKLTIPAGQRSADFTIEVADDAVPEV